jgi:ABC-type transport system substrate-binding protein/DNA-binding SARP family transcriptional activator/streptogramin lyase
VEVGVLGHLVVRDGGRSVALPRGKPTAVLAALLLHRNDVVSSERLIDEVWGENAPRTANKTLQLYVSQLRKVLPPDVLVTQPPGYLMRVSDDEIDSGRFEQLLASGRARLAEGEVGEAASTLRDALAIWRGPAFADVAYEDFARGESERLAELRLQAVEGRIEADLRCGRHAEVVGELTTLAREHPQRERLQAQLMLALYRSGRQSDALNVFREARRRLHDELGIEPGPELRELEGAILRQEAALAAPAPVTLPSRRGRREGRGVVLTVAAVLLVGAATAVSLGVVLSSSDKGPIRAAPNSVVAVDALNGRVVRRVPVGVGPGQATAGYGAVWTSNTVAGTVSRIDRATGQVETIPVGLAPSGLAVASGAVFVANGEANTLVRVDPGAARVVRTVRVGNAPSAVAVGQGALWVANTADGTVSRVDPGGRRASRTIPVGPNPIAVASGPGGIWVALAGSGAVARIDPTSNRVVATIAVGHSPSVVATDRTNVWVADAVDRTVSRLDPSSGAVVATVSVGARPLALATAAHSLWVALGNGSLVRLDRSTLNRRQTIELGSTPSGIAVTGTTLWITVLPAAASHRGGTLRVDVVWLDPCRCIDPAATIDPQVNAPMLGLVYDGLVAYRRVGGPAGGLLVGDLAVDVPAPSDGGRTYVFRLRPGLRYSDGAPVLASDVRHSFERVFRLNTELPPWYDAIVGAGLCSRHACDLSAGIDADDRGRTVTFHLHRADPEFLYKLALPLAFVVPGRTPFRVVRGRLPGTGPYTVVSYRGGKIGNWERSATVVLRRSRAFHTEAREARPPAFPDRIVFRVVPEVTRATTEVVHGTADVAFAYGYQPGLLERLAITHAAQLHADAVGGTEYMFLNTRVPPFDDVRVRRAVAYGVDRARLVQLEGGADMLTPTCQLLPPGLPGYRPYCPYTAHPSPAGVWTAPDLARARALVAASGTRGERVRVWTKSNHAVPGRLFAAVLRDLGYRTRLHVLSKKSEYYGAINRSGRVQIGWTGWIHDYASEGDFFTPTVSCAAMTGPSTPFVGNNFSKFCDHALDRLMASAERLQQTDPLAAAASWARIDRTVTESAAIVPYGTILSQTLVSRRVGNYQYHPQWGPLLDQLWVR